MDPDPLSDGTAADSQPGWLSVVVSSLAMVVVFAAITAAGWVAYGAVARGWTPTVIQSGSMSPGLTASDMVFYDPDVPDDLAAGTVITFTVDGHAVTHRITSVNEDGSYQTRGDANAAADSTPVTPDMVDGAGRLVVPLAGLPSYLARAGRWAELATVIAVLAAAAAMSAKPTAVASAAAAASRPRQRRRRGAVTAAAGVLILVALAAAIVPATRAAFADPTDSTSNRWAATTWSVCQAAPTVVVADADTEVQQAAPTSNFGTAATMRTQSRSSDTIRALVRFGPVPPAPTGCTVDQVQLRLYTTAAVADRVLAVTRAGTAWTETAANWNNQPAQTGTPVTAVTPTTGWMSWTVTGLGDPATGFVVVDATGNNAANRATTFSSRTNPATATRPQLVYTWR